MRLESRNWAPGTINARLAAGRRLAYEAADAVDSARNSLLGVRRVDGCKETPLTGESWPDFRPSYDRFHASPVFAQLTSD